MASKHALIIGINKYPYMEPRYQLSGCVNDAKLMRNTLINKFNFKRSEIVELHDEAATRSGIQAAMRGLQNRVKKDDVVVFHYSGHGHRCKSKTAFTDEGSGKDNCLLPHDDSKPKADGKPDYREIRDDVINDWLEKLASKTANITLIFDACHSGTMTRSAKPQAQARSVPEAVRRQPAPVNRDRAASTRATKGAGGWLTLNDNYVVISGCRDTQTSKERWFKEGDMQFRHGVLSYCLIDALTSAEPGTTYRDVFEKICSRVPGAAADQNPQIEGRMDRELFGVKDIEPLRYLPVSAVNGRILTLQGGAAHGLVKGTSWQVYPAGTKTTEGIQPLDIATIKSVGATTSKARLAKANNKVTVGCRSVEKEARLRTAPLQIYLDRVASNDARTLKSTIKKSKLLRITAKKRGADIIARITRKNSTAGKQLERSLGVLGEPLSQSDCWTFYYDDDSLAFNPHAVTERGVANLLAGNLEKIARYRRVLALDNPATKLNVTFNLYKRSKDDKLTLANGGGTEFNHMDDALVLEITNNEKERSLFFSLVWLSADMSIGTFYPQRKNSEEIAAGKTIRIGHQKNRRLLARLSPAIPGDVAMETCKLMVTSQQSDFSWLNQQATRSNKLSVSAVQEFDLAFRGDDTQTSVRPKDDWDAINRSITIRRTDTTPS